MIEHPACALCEERRWSIIATRTYRRTEMEARTRYVARRARILFEVWFPGRVEVTLASLLCEVCGFVTYAPRPAAGDLDAKYRTLSREGMDEEALAPAAARDASLRGRGIYRLVLQHWSAAVAGRLLDFGGGSGNLLRDFASAGWHCDVVDYCETTIAGVRRIGTTLQDVPPEGSYDVALASHVLEHVADPVGVLRALGARVRAGGILYVEVPMEILGGAPFQEEPVTHVNFFTPASTRFLLARAGLDVVRLKLGPGMGAKGLVVRAIGRAGAGPRQPQLNGGIADGVREVERLLSPSPMLQFRLRPRNTLRAAARRARRALGLYGRLRA